MANAWIFVFVLDLISAGFHALGRTPLFSEAGKFSAAERLERQIASRLGAHVEVLMKPTLRWNQQAAGAPVVSFRIFALPPHHGKAFPFKNDNVCSGTMTVGLLVGSHRELRDVSRHNVISHLDHDQSAARAAVFSFHKLEAAHIANKIRVRESLSRDFYAAVEKILLAVVAVGKRIVTLEDKIDVVK